ncbi:MAG: CAP domain-containing protein [Actinomycetota bacterium]|nr:CAP domain-containing protein [Actinomycetota bacterium]
MAAINSVRGAHGLAPLALDYKLQRAARAHSHDMLKRNYFAHGAFGQRMRRFHVRGPRAGENLAWHTGRLVAATAIQMWLASPGHRANLLHPGFRRIGVATPWGRFAGARHATVITTDFAGR